MGSYLKRFWEPDGGGTNKAERMGGVYTPYLPDKLEGFDLSLDASCSSAVADAQQALAQLNNQGTLTDTEPLARILLRAEAVSSSRIEGLEIPASKLLEYEELDRLGVKHRLDGVEAQVLGNIHSLTTAVEDIAMAGPLTVAGICSIHKALLKDTWLEHIGGILRTEQNWIGGNRINPVGAAYVPPEPDQVPSLLDDLVGFISTSSLPSVAIAAIAHAQFETIHPFADGNGRVGRAIIHIVLRRAGLCNITVPPVSLLLATDRERYIINLAAFRTISGEDRVTATNGWIEYFSRMLELSCKRALLFESKIKAIQQSWQDKTGFRAGSAGQQLVELLPGTPVISIKTAQALTQRSYPAARNAVEALVKAGVLRQNSKNRKSGIYVADDILDAFNVYERQLATLEGDTSTEKPKRNVPQRR